MAIEGILVAIDKQARAEAQAVVDAAQERADLILHDAERSALEKRERYVAEECERAKLAAARSLHSTRIANRRLLSDVKTQAYEKLYQKAEDKLTELRGCPEYPKIFHDLVRDALIGLGEDIILWVDPLDMDLAKETVGNLEFEQVAIEIKPSIATIGGIQASNSDGRILCDNTFEARLHRLQTEQLSEIMEVLDL